MDEALDIFRSDGFTVASLDRIVKNVTYVPQALGSMGIFTPKPISTIGIEIMQDQETLRLIPTTERGTREVEQARDSGSIRYLRTVRIAKKDRVIASELQDIIATYQQPNDLQLRTATELVVERLSKLKSEYEMTAEFHRLGALQALLYDADQTTLIYNFYTEFGITPPAIVYVDFTNLSQTAFFQYFVDTFTRPMTRSLKDRRTNNMGIAALVGDAFWAKLMTHPGFYAAVLTAQQGANLIGGSNPLMASNAWQKVYFGGITWINYMGTDDGSTIAIPTRDAIFFPMNVPDVFRQYQSPGETLKDVNTKGQPYYAYVQPDVRDQMASFVDIFLRGYPLFSCIYPQVLMRARIAVGQ